MKRAWNMINAPVYSVATGSNNGINMNICTYVTPVSMNPKQYTVAVYQNTLTLENLHRESTAVLLLLHTSHVSLVNTLGKKSGLHYDKNHYLAKKNLLTIWQGHTVLKNTCANILLTKRWSRVTGDHTLFHFDVKYAQTFNSEILELDHLRARKIIRI